MFTVQEILDATNGKLIKGSPDAIIMGISIDSRTIKGNELFIAVKGQRFDGHDFVLEVIKKGATGAVISESFSHLPFDLTTRFKKDKSQQAVFIMVPDTIHTLGDIAKYHRNRFNIPIVGITGSNGKTTTKEMIASILTTRFNVLKNEGTQNNLFGVPLTLLRLNSAHEVGVIEMGMNRLGEIKRLSEITQPNVGVITNISPSHLEFLDNINSVFKAKCELLDSLSDGDIAILNGDDKLLKPIIESENKRLSTVVTFGIETKCDFTASKIRCESNSLEFLLNEKQLIKLEILGRHNIYNALSAIATCSNFDIRSNNIIESLNLFKSPSTRMERKIIQGIEIIDDSYNSNPQSLQYAINFLSEYEARGKKILVSGDMLELGKLSKSFHYQVGKLIATSSIDMLILVGELSRYTADGAIEGGMGKSKIWWFGSTEEAAEVLREITKSGDIVLVKGSRAMHMEEVIRCFTISYIR